MRLGAWSQSVLGPGWNMLYYVIKGALLGLMSCSKAHCSISIIVQGLVWIKGWLDDSLHRVRQYRYLRALPCGCPMPRLWPAEAVIAQTGST